MYCGTGTTDLEIAKRHYLCLKRIFKTLQGSRNTGQSRPVAYIRRNGEKPHLEVQTGCTLRKSPRSPSTFTAGGLTGSERDAMMKKEPQHLPHNGEKCVVFTDGVLSPTKCHTYIRSSVPGPMRYLIPEAQ